MILATFEDTLRIQDPRRSDLETLGAEGIAGEFAWTVEHTLKPTTLSIHLSICGGQPAFNKSTHRSQGLPSCNTLAIRSMEATVGRGLTKRARRVP